MREGKQSHGEETDSVGARQRESRYRFKHTAEKDKPMQRHKCLNVKTNAHVHIAKLFIALGSHADSMPGLLYGVSFS